MHELRDQGYGASRNGRIAFTLRRDSLGSGAQVHGFAKAWRRPVRLNQTFSQHASSWLKICFDRREMKSTISVAVAGLVVWRV